MDGINWFNDFYSDMFFLDVDSLFSIVDLNSFSHFVIDNQLVIGLHVVPFRGNRAPNFKSAERVALG